MDHDPLGSGLVGEVEQRGDEGAGDARTAQVRVDVDALQLRGDSPARPVRHRRPGVQRQPRHPEHDATPFRQATQSVYEEFYATPAGKDAKKMVDFILAVK